VLNFATKDCYLQINIKANKIIKWKSKALQIHASPVRPILFRLGYGLDDWGSIPGMVKDFFLFSTASGLAMGLTQPHI
jgi:hypothetical protein